MDRHATFAPDAQILDRELLDDTQCADLARRASAFGGTLLLIRQKSGGRVGGRRCV